MNCGLCIHRTYGDQRLYGPCLIIEPFWSNRKPKPRNFGAACSRFEPTTTPTPTLRERA